MNSAKSNAFDIIEQKKKKNEIELFIVFRQWTENDCV